MFRESRHLAGYPVGRALIIVMLSTGVLSGCGGGERPTNPPRTTQATEVPAEKAGTRLKDAHGVGTTGAAPKLSPGQIVNPTRVPAVILHSGYEIVFRRAPTPAPFARAIFGTARNSRGTTIEFGFLLTGGSPAGEYYRPALRKLVPHATAEGSTAGETYISITSAGAGGAAGRRSEEEFEMADALQTSVASLAPKAHLEE